MAVNLSRLKAYAPKARRDFRQAVTERAARLGITANAIAEADEQGDVVVLGGIAYSKAVGKQRKELLQEIKSKGFDQVIEEVAYTWFNRFVAIRFMELHEFLGHAYSVFENPDASKPFPQILYGAENLDFQRLPRGRVQEIKAAGNYEEKLYRAIILAQCNELHKAMPFLFENIGDATEILLPDDLLSTDGLVRKLVAASNAIDWNDVEVIGWLYQFYISEKKDEVFDSLKNNIKVSTVNIPAATQLFTPHWIVRQIVENSLGRLWMQNRPNSQLQTEMPYFISKDPQDANYLKLATPEDILVCDPACGSGHMLTYAFDLLYKIYEEEGYQSREIPKLIISKNIHGIEIDQRAGGLAAFCLTMKARMHDVRFFERAARPQIHVLENVAFTAAEMEDVATVVGRENLTDDLSNTLAQFNQVKSFGSLIVPKLKNPAKILSLVESRSFADDLLLKDVHDRVLSVLRMAEALSAKYHVVVANPPYMGTGGYNAELKKWCNKNGYKTTRSDLYAAFIERSVSLVLSDGFSGLVTRQDWAFTKSYEYLRDFVLNNADIELFSLLGKGVFETLSGEVVQPVSFVLSKGRSANHLGMFCNATALERDERIKFVTRRDSFRLISERIFDDVPLKAFIFWKSPAFLKMFVGRETVRDRVTCREGIHTGSNETYLRSWWEISSADFVINASNYETLDRSGKYVPYNKGGSTDKWYGGNQTCIAFSQPFREEMKKLSGHVRPSEGLYFKEGGTWADVASKGMGVRYYPQGFLFDGAGPVVVGNNINPVIANMNSKPFYEACAAVMPNLHFKSGTVNLMPLAKLEKDKADLVELIAANCISITKSSWDSYETSWDFNTTSLLQLANQGETLAASYAILRSHWQRMTDEIAELEEQNNRIFIESYGLGDELDPKLPLNEVSLISNPDYRYGTKGDAVEREIRLRADTVTELISYSVGCMMGRYSLIEPGLIYANRGNVGFDPGRYGLFQADDDGIVPVTDSEWFSDDASARFSTFMNLTFGDLYFTENMDFVADNLDRKAKENAGDTIRRYFSRSFFKEHLRRYKNKPIYWLFSSGKERAFECLVYLHRYEESTLGRMRMEYVIPLQTKMANRIEALNHEAGSGDLSSAALKNLTKKRSALQAQKIELDRFESKLRHMAEERISLDLDLGVKANYAKFGDLLVDVKTVTASKDEA